MVCRGFSGQRNEETEVVAVPDGAEAELQRDKEKKRQGGGQRDEKPPASGRHRRRRNGLRFVLFFSFRVFHVPLMKLSIGLKFSMTQRIGSLNSLWSLGGIIFFDVYEKARDSRRGLFRKT
jgi:hypothetical protein